jgi:hypothetical protein
MANDDPSFTTGDVFDKLNDTAKYGGDPSRLMWRERQWRDMGNMRIYSSSWWWPI